MLAQLHAKRIKRLKVLHHMNTRFICFLIPIHSLKKSFFPLYPQQMSEENWCISFYATGRSEWIVEKKQTNKRRDLSQKDFHSTYTIKLLSLSVESKWNKELLILWSHFPVIQCHFSQLFPEWKGAHQIDVVDRNVCQLREGTSFFFFCWDFQFEITISSPDCWDEQFPSRLWYKMKC